VTTLSDRKGDYGFDAPNVLLTLTGIGLVFLAIAVVLAAFHVGFWAPAASISLVVLLGAASFTYTTRRGKFVVWAEILDGLQLRGDERVLDMGSGRGAIQLMAAQLVPRGQAVGLDLWLTADQSGNAAAAASRNAESEGVAGNTAFETGDMSKMPFPDNSFDLVVSSLAIHNIHDAATRQRAIDEAVRGDQARRQARHRGLHGYQRLRETAGRARDGRREQAQPWLAILVRVPVDRDVAGDRDQAQSRLSKVSRFRT